MNYVAACRGFHSDMKDLRYCIISGTGQGDLKEEFHVKILMTSPATKATKAVILTKMIRGNLVC
jgi:hypothetical protein